MKIALISDIHGNEVALSAVLNDIDQIGVSEIVCLGDVATLGSQPKSVIRILQELGCKCINGNHDEFLIKPELIHAYTETPVIVEAVDWCREQLSTDELDFLRSFQPTIEISLGFGSSLLLYHGSPSSNTMDILSTTSSEDLDLILSGLSASVLAGGHTHIQMLRQHKGTLVVNPGSVGFPFKEYVVGRSPTLLDHAEYAIVEATNSGINVNFCRVEFDKALLREAVLSSENPLRDWILDQYP